MKEILLVLSPVDYIDHIDYLLYWLVYTVIGHSLIIRICAIFLTACLLTYGVLLFWMWRVRHVRKKHQRLGDRVRRQYYDEMLDISLDSRTLSPGEIADRLHYHSHKRAQTGFTIQIVSILTEINHRYESQINQRNYQGIQSIFQITRFMEHVIRFGSVNRQLTALKALESINCHVSEAVLLRTLYHRNYHLRFSGRCAYLWLSQDDPFRFLNEDANIDLTRWGMMSVHNGFVYRKREKNNTLQLSRWLESLSKDNTKEFIIKEIQLSNSTEDLNTVAEYVTAPNPRIRTDAITALGAMNYRESVPLFMEMYTMQSDDVKRAIIKALGEMPSEQSYNFLYNVYQKETNVSTRLAILRALYSQPDVGGKLFNKLEQQADDDTRILFQHVKNPLITHLNPTI
jgi:hypothetical protein